MDPICSSANRSSRRRSRRARKSPKSRSRSALAFPKAFRLTTSILKRRSGCWRCRAKSDCRPKTGEPITRRRWTLRPYVKHGKTYANLEDGDDVLTIGLNRAVTLIAEKKANPKKGRRFGADPGKVLGEHPDKGGPVVVKNGRYGPYVSHNGINATITGDKTPETITLTEAVVLLDARAEQLSSQPRRAAGRKKAGEPSEAPKGRKKKAAEPADTNRENSQAAQKPAKKPAKVTAAE